MTPAFSPATRALAEYFEAVVSAGAPAKAAASWISVELLRRLKEAGKDIDDCPVLRPLWRSCSATSRAATSPRQRKKSLRHHVRYRPKRRGNHRRGRPRADYRRRRDREKSRARVVAKSPDNVAKYRSGNEGVFKFFVGQVMRETRGQANPQMVNETLKDVLGRI